MVMQTGENTDPDQPFFSVVNITVCHESQIRHGEVRHAEVIRKIGTENQRDPQPWEIRFPITFPTPLRFGKTGPGTTTISL